MRSIRHLILAAGLLIAATPPSQADDPVLRRVLLSTGGVGYFGYETTPDPEGRVWLTVPLAQVDDILKSLTVLGADGAVRGVSLQGPTPLRDLFRDLPFAEGDLADLPGLLARMRGAEVRIVGRASLQGRILTVAREETVEGDTRMPRHRLSLAGPEGIRTVILEAIDGLSFVDAELQHELDRLLVHLAERGLGQERKLEIRLAPGAVGPVGVGYLAEMPLWKASWRLVAGAGEGLLQGWAIFENASGQDWRDVAVTLIGGSPRALRQALFASHYVVRPELPVAEEMRKQDMVARMAAAPAPALEADLTSRSLAAALDTGAAQELTAQTMFPLPQPVTLAQGQTVMAPIVDRTVSIERVALYRAHEPGPHPHAAMRLRNTTGASLPAGLATLYESLPEGGLTFLGDASLPQLAPGAEELLAYGSDGAIDVTVQERRDGRIDRARVVDGVLELTRLQQERYGYAVTARFSGPPRSFVLEQPRPEGARVAEPADAVVQGDLLTVARSLEPGGRLELTVVLERPELQRFALLEHDPQALLLEFQGVEVPPDLQAALARLQELSATVGGLDRQIADAAGRRDEIAGDQARIRENLAAVPPESDLARRYLAGLAASEDELEVLATRLAGLQATREQALRDRADFVRGLEI